MKNSNTKILLLIAFFIASINSFSQQKRKVLLTDMNIQIESTDAVNHLYNFKFDRAIQGFNYLKYRYPTHPMPYFLIGFAYWWRMQPDVSSIKDYDDIFKSYMDSCIYFAEDIYDDDENNIDAIFFLSAAHGFMARIHGERENYMKATNHGRKSISYMEEGEKFTEFSSEFLFGLGLYNYYEPWLKENYGYLRPILFFFGDGDKELGVKQLQEVAKTAFYTRTEAQYFLIDILKDQKMHKEAGETVDFLVKTYPDNPVFQKEYAKVNYSKFHKKDEMIPLCKSMLEKMEQGFEGYNAHICRQAAYYLGYIYLYYEKDYDTAIQYYIKNIELSESIPILESNYYHHSLHEVGDYYHSKKKDYPNAKIYYEKVVKLTSKKKEIHKDAKKKLKKYKKMKV